MPTSLECVQYLPTKASFGHSRRLSSVPPQPIFVNNTGPLPVPNFELEVGYSANPVLCRKKPEKEYISNELIYIQQAAFINA